MKLRGGGHNSEPGVAIRYAECGTATTVCQPRPNCSEDSTPPSDFPE